MEKEVIELELKAEVKPATKKVKEFTKSIIDAKTEFKNLNEQMSIQKGVITELEKNLVLMEAKLRDTPRTGAAGFYALEDAIEKSNEELKLEKIGLKEIKNQLDDNVKSTKALEGAGKKGAKGFKALKTSVQAFGLALKAAGIGLIIAGFVALKEALGRNQKALDTYDTTMTAISLTFNQVVDALIKVYTWVTASSDRFNALGKVIDNLTIMALTPFIGGWQLIKLAIQSATLAWEESFFGDKDAVKIVELKDKIKETTKEILEIGDASLRAGKKIWDNAGEAMTEIGDIYDEVAKNLSKINIKANIELAAATTEAKNAAAKAGVEVQGLINKFNEQAEIQRQIRDDETKTFAKRIEASNEVKRILNEQKIQALLLIETRKTAAALELEGNKKNVILQNAYNEILNEEFKIKAKIARYESEQKKNQASLEKELLDIQKQLAEEGLSGTEKELLELENAYQEKLKMAKKSETDITNLKKQNEKQKAAIIRAGVATQLDAYANLAGALKTLAGENKQLAIAEAIIATWSAATKALDAKSPLNFINMAAVLAAGFANVQKIMQTDVGTGAGGSVPSGSLSTPAPEMLSGKFTLGNVQEQQPIQAYVVTDSLTDNQNKLAYIRRRATI